MSETVAGEKDKAEPFEYAVVDLASADSLRPLISTMTAPAVMTLFDRKAARQLLMVGPWLVRLSRAPEVKEMLAEMPKDLPWGYYLYTRTELTGLRQSLRRYNLARLPGRDREVLFRYWDPRVMGVFLQTMTRHQHTRFFDMVERIVVPHAGLDVHASDPPGLGLGAAPATA